MKPAETLYFSKQTYTKSMIKGQSSIENLQVQENVRDVLRAIVTHFKEEGFDEYKIEMDNGTLTFTK